MHTWDVVVVGGGLLGSAMAYHLARRGVRTLLLEAGDLAGGASGANFGNIQVQDAEFGLSMELTLRGRQSCAGLEEELGRDIGFRQSGSVLLIENERQWHTLAARAESLQAAGVPSQLLEREEACRLVPGLNPDSIVGALFHAEEGMVDPVKLVHAYVRRGMEYGLEVWTHTPATAVRVERGRAAGVETRRGRTAAGQVVLAAGAWARALAATAGVDIPLRWVHGQALATERLPALIPHALSSAAFFEQTEESGEMAVGFCMRQRPEGNFLIGEAAQVTPALPREVTAGALPAIAGEAVRRFPILRQRRVLRGWAVPVAFTDDRRPLLGYVDGVEGLLAATGLKSTIVLTPVVGELVADMVMGRPVDPRLAEFAPSRAMPRNPATSA